MAKAKKKTDNGGEPDVQRVSRFDYYPEDLVIVEDPKHPLYDKRRVERPITEAFIDNIAENGVIQTITFTKDGKDALVVAGRRRTRAARIVNERRKAAGLEPIRVPCLYRRAKNAAQMMALMVSENEQREDDDPVGRSEKMLRMLNFGATEDEIANAFGVTKQTVTSALSLMDLDQEVKDSIGPRLSATAAAKLAKLSRAEQREKLNELLSGSTGKRVTVQKAARAAGGSAQVHQRSTPVKHVRTLRDMLAGSTRHATECSVLRWVTGEIDLETLGNELPGLSSYITQMTEKA